MLVSSRVSITSREEGAFLAKVEDTGIGFFWLDCVAE